MPICGQEVFVICYPYITDIPYEYGEFGSSLMNVEVGAAQPQLISFLK